jgi:uncharacterized membrane protein (UPF0127 family)
VAPKRLQRLQALDLPGSLRLYVARSAAARLVGLAMLPDSRLPPWYGLLLPGCSSVHTFGMLFALDLIFLDGRGGVVRLARRVRPARIARCGGGAAVVEVRAGAGGLWARALRSRPAIPA